jgi:hypothetical protein
MKAAFARAWVEVGPVRKRNNPMIINFTVTNVKPL